MARGLQEELNLQVNPDELELLFITQPTPELAMFQAVYLYRSDQESDYNPDEFTDFQWRLSQEVIALVTNGETAKSNLAPTIQRAFL